MVIPLVGIIGFYVYKRISGKQSNRRFYLETATFFAFLILCVEFQYADIKPVSFKNPIFDLKIIASNVPQIFIITILFFTLYGIKNIIFLGSARNQINRYVWMKLGIVTCAISQLFPGSDPLHIWWISPVLILAIFDEMFPKSGISQLLLNKRRFLTVLTTLLIALFLQYVQEVEKPRVAYENKSLKGMVGRESDVYYIDKTMLALERYAQKDIKVGFVCEEGLYAVSFEKYIASSRHFISLIENSRELAEAQKVTFYCDIDEPKISLLEKSNKSTIFKIQSKPNRFNVIVEQK